VRNPRRIPGTLDTTRHCELVRGVTLSAEPYLNVLDRTKVSRLIDSGQLTIFRLQKCEGPLCDALLPTGTHKRFCSKGCWGKLVAIHPEEGEDG
jgi:hypothetical protein